MYAFILFFGFQLSTSDEKDLKVCRRWSSQIHFIIELISLGFVLNEVWFVTITGVIFEEKTSICFLSFVPSKVQVLHISDVIPRAVTEPSYS